MQRRRDHRHSLLLLAAATLVAISGCRDPLSRSDRELQWEALEASRAQLKALSAGPDIEVKIPESALYAEFDEDRVEQLDKLSGPDVYTQEDLDLGVGLDGRPSKTIKLSLQRAIQLAVRNNLDLKVAQIVPGISEADVIAAEAAFDATFSTSIEWRKTDRPQQGTVLNTLTVGTTTQQRDNATFNVGINKRLESGAQLAVSTGFDYTNNKTRGLNVAPDPAFTNNVTVGINQPLLRNFGSRVNRSQIHLARNAHRRDVLDLHSQLLDLALQVEQGYWNLVFARYQLAIQQRLLKRTVNTRDTLLPRREYDVSPVQIAQAYSFVELRQADVLSARQAVRDATDNLKLLINAPDLPISDETLIEPIDRPVEVSVEYSLLDAITTALQHRPEVRTAVLNIDDSSIRQMVADNQRLPQLVLNAQIQYFGLAEQVGEAYEELGEGDFIEYLIGLQFEQPIGNRAAEAAYRQARLTRRGTVMQYKSVVQQVVASVKRALRQARTNLELIDAFRAARRAASDNLRAIEKREETGEQLTPEFLLDLKLQTQERLSNAEIRELQSVIDYNIALVQLHQSLGTLLRHNGIEFVWPEDMFVGRPRD